MAHRLFSVEEANALLPILRPLLAQALEARRRVIAAEPDLWPVLEKAMGNGGSKKAGAVLADFETIQQNVKAIQSMGIEVKDINTGLIDFPAVRDGREVCLCWRYDEPDVAHWHDTDAGFAGRQRL
ncbi:MAG: DUF2203 domain-containing protein [Chloroflexi bacterium]|nr:DUF2203 domain-containing protein [Chloroflexota bacterium]MBI3177931.1 DUF2203 domain-containing protein [Chloroflexota bacterium]